MGNNINNNGNHDFKMKTAEFQGYTIKALEDLTKEICDLKIEIKETNNRLEKLNTRLYALQTKIAGIGATSALIVSVAIHYLFI